MRETTEGIIMDIEKNTDTPNVDEMPLVHQAGKFVFSGAVSFAANMLAERTYDAAYRIYRSRKS
jgi:hypothetical protein